MPATGNTAARGKRKILITALLLIGLMVGLAACRGFFGQAPIALLTYTYTPITDGEVPVTVTFDISGSTDPDGNIASYELDYGDGSTHATGTDVADDVSHTYMEADSFTVTLTVTDGDGRIGMATATFTIGPAMITFASDLGGNYGIYRMLADGSGAAAVVNTSDDELFPDLVKGTRDMIAYASDNGGNWNIWKIAVTGGAGTHLTTQTDSNQIQPTWSRDASTIAYASNAAQTPSATTWEIYTMTASGGSQTQLTTQSPSWAIAPAYSPANDDIVFVSDLNGDGGSSLWWYDDSSGTISELQDGPGRDGDASPALPGVLGTDLHLPPGAGISRPAWSPDGTKIAFSRERTTGQIDVYVMDAGGSNVKSLEEYVHAEYGVVTNTDIMTTDNEFSPYWLEDGSGLVFARESSGKINLYKVLFVATDTDPIGSIVALTSSTTHNNVMPAAKR